MTIPLPAQPDVLSLRERTRSAVRWQVGDVALQLFDRQGFDETTVDQIAVTAGISRSSFFRYFASKEDVVVLQLQESGAALRRALAARPVDEPAWPALRQACIDICESSARDAAMLERGLHASRVHARTPSVRARVRDEMASWRDQLVPELHRRMGLGDPDPLDPRPSALAAAAIAGLDVAIVLWQDHGDETSLADLVRAALDQFEVLPPATEPRRRPGPNRRSSRRRS